MSLVNAVRSDIFFLSVTALMCFVLDHLLWPASDDGEVISGRKHCLQKFRLVDGRGDAESNETALRAAEAAGIVMSPDKKNNSRMSRVAPCTQ